MTYTERLPLTVFDDKDDGFDEIEVAFNWTPGTPEFIPPYNRPEDYDPGSGDEIELTGAAQVTASGTLAPFMIAPEWEPKIIEYLDEHWERPDHAAELADYRYDQWRDEQMEKRA